MISPGTSAIAVTWVASADYETENGVSLSGTFPSSTLETLVPDQGVVVYEQVVLS